MYDEPKKMTKKEALTYIMTSEPNSPVYQRALVAVQQADNFRTRLIAWMALGLAVLSLIVNVLLHK